MKTKDGLPFCIDFDTNEMPGKIVAIRVILDKYIFGPDDSVRIDLVDHPLYKKLEAYVKTNPSRG